MVTGLPSSGIEYEVRSVLRDKSVAKSVAAISSPEFCNVVDSVGAGNGGFLRLSMPIANVEAHEIMKLLSR